MLCNTTTYNKRILDFFCDLLDAKQYIEHFVAENFAEKHYNSVDQYIEAFKSDKKYAECVSMIGEEQMISLIKHSVDNIVQVKVERWDGSTMDDGMHFNIYLPRWKDGYRDQFNIEKVMAKVIWNMLDRPYPIEENLCRDIHCIINEIEKANNQ